MSFGATIDAAGLGTPPIGTGGYATWFVFVLVIMLAVIFANWLIAAAGVKK